MNAASVHRSAWFGWAGRLAPGLAGKNKHGDPRVRCAACGALNAVPTCLSCGTRLPAEAVAHINGLAANDELETASGRDQTSADGDQTGSDRDQTGSDHDQAASESDQRSADEDQDASDTDYAAGGDTTAHHRSSTLARKRTTRNRAAATGLRNETAGERLRTADERDREAALRDRGAESRDESARLHDLQDDTDASPDEIRLRAERDRARAAADRVKAADDRSRAASERKQAAAERAEALRLRNEVEIKIKHATTDETTGARSRDFGLEEMARELDRASRTGGSLVLAFVDIDGLKQVNDSQGHLAGDALLHRTGEALRRNVRAYDIVVRYGGDEFVCAMPNLSLTTAGSRLQTVAATLAADDADHSIAFGLAEAQPGESLIELIARADADLLNTRHSKEARAAPQGV